VTNLLLHLVKDGKLELNFEDEITKGTCVTHAGKVVNERAREMMEPAASQPSPGRGREKAS
jgi:NAD(P) transhydrogenase subunit alpha